MDKYEQIRARFNDKIESIDKVYSQILLLYNQIDGQRVRMREELKPQSVLKCIQDIQDTAQELLSSIIGEIPSHFTNANEIYTCIKQDAFPYNMVDTYFLKDAISEYLSYVDGMEDFVILTFKINDGELAQSAIDSKMDVVMEKDLSFVSGLTTKTRKVSINEAMKELESVIDFTGNIMTLSEAVEDCAMALTQQINTESSVELKIAKIKAFCLYVTSLMRFCSSVSDMAGNLKGRIDASMKSRTPVSGEKDETILKIV